MKGQVRFGNHRDGNKGHIHQINEWKYTVVGTANQIFSFLLAINLAFLTTNTLTQKLGLLMHNCKIPYNFEANAEH